MKTERGEELLVWGTESTKCIAQSILGGIRKRSASPKWVRVGTPHKMLIYFRLGDQNSLVSKGLSGAKLGDLRKESEKWGEDFINELALREEGS